MKKQNLIIFGGLAIILLLIAVFSMKDTKDTGPSGDQPLTTASDFASTTFVTTADESYTDLENILTIKTVPVGWEVEDMAIIASGTERTVRLRSPDFAWPEYDPTTTPMEAGAEVYIRTSIDDRYIEIASSSENIGDFFERQFGLRALRVESRDPIMLSGQEAVYFEHRPVSDEVRRSAHLIEDDLYLSVFISFMEDEEEDYEEWFKTLVTDLTLVRE